ncbi:MAG: TraR/DksA C4-type zinc finger protein [Gammaproteobacteria bacterium]|nr:TraR/DksA C4-type zinc finger protein [Gammaproteobacteria bacterium]NNF60503.1 TraR/DksA family transcriptional regulator [Gammaproteobacteria bacterium]NNM21770.1 TraR/DksA family transcriptional regulator [Gammaproteobacteria bacterium]
MELDLEKCRQQLLALQAELRDVAETGDAATATVELDQTRVGRLSRMDAMQAQAMSLEARRRREDTLRRVAAALRRLDGGDYGYCAGCDEPVDPRRLEFDPAATHCISCATAMDGSS